MFLRLCIDEFARPIITNLVLCTQFTPMDYYGAISTAAGQFLHLLSHLFCSTILAVVDAQPTRSHLSGMSSGSDHLSSDQAKLPLVRQYAIGPDGNCRSQKRVQNCEWFRQPFQRTERDLTVYTYQLNTFIHVSSFQFLLNLAKDKTLAAQKNRAKTWLNNNFKAVGIAQVGKLESYKHFFE